MHAGIFAQGKPRPDFERLFRALPSPYMVLDTGLNFVAVNEEYERVTMRTADQLLGRNLFDEFPNEGESGQRLRASIERVFATGEPDTIAYIHYDIPRPDSQGGGVERRFWTAVHTPLLDDAGAVGHVVQNTVDVTEIVRLKEATSLPFRVRTEEMRLIERAQQADRMREETLSQSDDFRRMFQLAPGFFAVLSGADHVFTFANDAYLRLTGERSLIGKTIREAIPEIVGQGFIEMLDGVYRTGLPASGEAVRVLLRQQPDGVPQELFLDFSYDAIRDAQGNISGVFVQGMDRTEAVRAQQRQRLLLDELNHRVKNTLAGVQSIVSQTLRTARDIPSAKTDIEARLVALSKAHNLLSAAQWASTELGALVRSELFHLGAGRVALAGPTVVLNPKASIAVAMVVHELTTNAVKYGALSAPEGSVAVAWTLDSDELVITWSERGGPPVTPPTRQGFGSRMIDKLVTGELAGRLAMDYAPLGFSCRIVMPRGGFSGKPAAGDKG